MHKQMAKMSPTGRAKLEKREGLDLKASLSGIPNDPWTIGYGHTHFDGGLIPAEGMTITKAEADAMLTHDLVRYENIVIKSVNNANALADHEFDALVSLCYNVEEALSPHSSIVKALNEGDKAKAAADFMLYNIPPEIIGRRKSEQIQFLTPYTVTNPKETVHMTEPSAAASVAATTNVPTPTVVPVLAVKATAASPFAFLETFPFASVASQLQVIGPMLPVIATFVPGLALFMPTVEAILPIAQTVFAGATAVQANVKAGTAPHLSIATMFETLAAQIKAMAPKA
jgi:lysozyme